MLLEFLQAITGVFVVVYDGQHGLKFTLGRAKGVVGPGVHWKWPIIQNFRLEETKHTTLDLEPQVIQLQDDLVYEVDAKVMYQIVDLRKAIIEIDDLVTGLQNRVVLAVQRVVGSCDRESVLDTDSIVLRVREELRPVEEQWGVRILQFGFSNISPSPSSLEITQLDLLARERLDLFNRLRADELPAEAAVALVTGAVVTTGGPPTPMSWTSLSAEEDAIARQVREWAEEAKRRMKAASGTQEAPDEGESTEGGDSGSGSET